MLTIPLWAIGGLDEVADCTLRAGTVVLPALSGLILVVAAGGGRGYCDPFVHVALEVFTMLDNTGKLSVCS